MLHILEQINFMPKQTNCIPRPAVTFVLAHIETLSLGWNLGAYTASSVGGVPAFNAFCWPQAAAVLA